LAFGFGAFFSAAGFFAAVFFGEISKKYTCWRVPHLYKYECSEATFVYLEDSLFLLKFKKYFFLSILLVCL
jgi:hypothetical protein